MNVIVVDDEKLLLDDFVSQLNSLNEINSVQGFSDGKKAEEYAYKNPNKIDAAFLDIKMNGMNGIVLAKKLKIINPKINIIFLTAYTQYAIDAMKIHASGYILKPPTDDDIRRELLDLRIPKELHKNNIKKLIVNCFGNFEVYANNKPCEFRYTKTKELLAYLVDRRGALCTNGELISVLWEDKEISPSLFNQLRNLISDMRCVLK